jgi:hypothetical protein
MATPSWRSPSAGRQSLTATSTKNADAARRGLYRLGGVAALLTFLLVLADIVITAMPGESDTEPGTLGATGWFAVLQKNPLLGLRNLGLINVVNLLLSLPLFAALYAAHRRANGPPAALASLVQFVGVAVYVANNKTLPLLALSKRHAIATDDGERSRLVTAGEALLAQGEDFTPGTFPGFLLTGVAGVLMGLVVLQSRVFGKVTGWAGVLGASLLTVFAAWATFVGTMSGPAMVFAAAGGLLSLAWYALLSRGLLRLGRGACASPLAAPAS